MLVLSTLVKNSELITVDFFDRLWPARLIKYRDFTYRIIMVVIFSVLLYEGWLMAWNARNVYMVSLKIKKFWPYLSIPMGIFFTLIQHSIVLYKLMRKMKE
jgi:TRAP-type C4-dicarboxylate transport system permease small subunit